jgi:hypothetical protein
MSGAAHAMEFHAVTGGDCWGGIVGRAPVRLAYRDVVLFPHGDAHVASSAPGMRANPGVASYYEARTAQLPFRLAYNGIDGPKPAPHGHAGPTTLVCGFLSYEVRPFIPLIAAPPRAPHLRAAAGAGWIVQSGQQAVAESHAKRPGGEAMLARMREMVFVDAVRRDVDGLPRAGNAARRAGAGLAAR